MMETPFRICITRGDNNEPAYLRPNSVGERDFVSDIVSRATTKLLARRLFDAVVDRTIAKGVGILRTEAHVRADMQAALAEVDPVLAFQQDLISSLAQSILAVKAEVEPT